MTTPETIALTLDDAHRCTLWPGGDWRPCAPDRRPGLIGGIQADTADGFAALMARACAVLRARGCDAAYGPVNGDIWHGYRAVIETTAAPAFPLEPCTPAFWTDGLRRAGFEAVVAYRSTVGSLPAPAFLTRPGRAAALRGAMRIRPLDLTRWEDELARIHAVSLQCFVDSPLYSPLSLSALSTLYAPLRSQIDPAWCRIAEVDGVAIGFIFAFPIAEWPQAGARTLALKTLAVTPGRRFAGLGRALIHDVCARATAAGFTHALHALMREGIASEALSRRLGRCFRRYALFRRGLQ